MATWKQIQDYVRGKYKLKDDSDDRFSMIWSYDGGRTQLIRVHKYTAFDEDFVRFRTAVCREGEIAPKLALAKNSNFAIGALAFDGNTLVLEYAMPLRGTDFQTFEIPLRVLPRTADSLEATYSAADDVF